MRTLQTVEGTPRCLVRVRTRPVCLTAFVLILSTASVGAQQPQAVPVGTIYAERQPIAQTRAFVGRIEATDRVEIRARVKGYLDAVLFKEGDLVKEGDVLYRIEPDTFQAAVQQAQGALYEAQGKFANASAQRARTEELVKTATASRALLDERVGNEKEAQGQVVTADANLKTATVNLGYTEIVAPISGAIGRSKFTKGNVVSPDEMVARYGADAARLYSLFAAPPERDLDWQDSGIEGIQRFLGRVYRFVENHARPQDPGWRTRRHARLGG